MADEARIDLRISRWDLTTFWGRLRHYANITDPRNALVSRRKLDEAKHLIQLYNERREPPGTKTEDLYTAQKLYQSAFHPDTSELQNVAGRMSFQVPGGTVLIAAMLVWYKSTTAVIFWQWANQSFNALVNYTNRNAKSPLTGQQIGVAYVSATASALLTAIGLKSFLSQRAGTLAQRFVPLIAVAAANCVNIPLMRQNELKDGITLTDQNDHAVAKSKVGAVKAVSLVTVSRIAIATPSMLVTPVVMEKLEKTLWFQRRKKLFNIPLQVFLSAAFLLFMVPVGCSLFPQRNWITEDTLKRWERPVHSEIRKKLGDEWLTRSDRLYFNKGL